MPDGQVSPDRGERLPREEKLLHRADFQRCYRGGRRRHGRLVTLHFAPNELQKPRIGITATRKIGKAVVRQRLKRRVREVYRRWEGRAGMPALDLVVHFKAAAAASDFGELRFELLRLLEAAAKKAGE